MWKPPQRIRHQVKPGPWPTAAEARVSRLFSPVEIGPLRLRHRTWVPAMVPWRASVEGCVTPGVIEWYRRFAMGKPGAIVVEATGIRDVPSGPLMRISHHRFIAGLKDLTEAVREASRGETKLFIQLIDFLSIRRRPRAEDFFQRFLRITDWHRKALAMPNASEEELRSALLALDPAEWPKALAPRELQSLTHGDRERVTDVHLPHIRDLPDVIPGLFADAAERAREAGFDGVELHYAHAYTMASFLSATNDRDDGYGGTPQGRLRLPMETYSATRQRVGDDYALGCRFLSEDCLEDGSTLEDACYFGVEFAKAGMDFLSLSRGGKFDDAQQPKVGQAVYPYTGPSGYECMPTAISDEQGPFGRNLEPARKIRDAIHRAGKKTPLVVAGGIHGFDQAEAVLAEKGADIIGLARQSLADPDWFIKVRQGRGAQVNLCKYSNYCEGLDQHHKAVTCQLWDRLDLDDPAAQLSEDKKRRLTAPLWRSDQNKKVRRDHTE